MRVYPVCGYQQTYTCNPQKYNKFENRQDMVILKKYNPCFTSYKNLLKINPYEMLLTPNSANALEDYIRHGMFIHVKPIGKESFGDVFWNEFIKLKDHYKNCSDTDQIYTNLRQIAENLTPVHELDEAAAKQVTERATALGTIVKNFLKDRNIYVKPESTYLDIGCGNGEVAKAISEELGFNASAVKGLEILERNDYCNIKRFRFDGRHIPQTFEKSDFVTIFNVLHHTRSYREAYMLLKSAYENMRKGGILMIREHNVNTINDIKYWQVRHLLPIRVSKVDPPCLVQDTVYHSADEWKTVLNNIGFKTKHLEVDKPYGSIYSFYLVMQK